MGNLFFVKHGGPEDNTLEEPLFHPNLYVGTAINCKWSTLEPTQNVFDFTCLNTGLTNVAAYNALYPAKPMGVEFRIWAGKLAPAWAQNLDGAPIALPFDSTTIGRWWTPNYRAAWKALQDATAAAYNNNSLLREVSVSSCAQYSEPLDEPLDPDDKANVIAAGYTDSLGYACLRGGFVDDFASWTRPALIFNFNPMRLVDGPSTFINSPNVISLMQLVRSKYGQSATVGTAGMSTTPDSTFLPWLAYTCPLNGPVMFQIQAAEFHVGAQDTAFANAQSYCMTNFEMWNTFGQGGVNPNTVTLQELQGWSTALGGY